MPQILGPRADRAAAPAAARTVTRRSTASRPKAALPQATRSPARSGPPGGARGTSRESGRLDDQHGAACVVADRVGHAAEDLALHALVADHEHVRVVLVGQLPEHLGGVALLGLAGRLEPSLA